MLKVNSIDHINFFVKNLDESVRFYCDLFGFTVKQKGSATHGPYKIIGRDNVHLCMYQKPDLEIGEGVNHFGFNIDNFDEIAEACKKMNVPHYLYDWEKSRSIYIEDPNGYEIELSEIQGGGL
jgi:catechol 2,3-dioxygenase-like lactoylglutathione lyase family enzyme